MLKLYLAVPRKIITLIQVCDNSILIKEYNIYCSRYRNYLTKIKTKSIPKKILLNRFLNGNLKTIKYDATINSSILKYHL